MNRSFYHALRISLVRCILSLALFSFVCVPVCACTVFVLTGTGRTLFCNNEDWSDPETRIWFIPAGSGHHGCVYVGFNNGVAQGGMNTKGLAWDVVAGFDQDVVRRPMAPPVRGNPFQRMLETCATVDEAIAFWQTHGAGAWIVRTLIADQTGASVIIGAKDGKLLVEQANQCRGFGYAGQVLDKMLAKDTDPTVDNGARILGACLQEGKYATKYSNVFDLKSGEIYLFPVPGRDAHVKLNLAEELGKEGHYYDMRRIREQLRQEPLPLTRRMQRLPLDAYRPIPDKEPKLTAHARSLIMNAVNGTLQADHFTEDSWRKISPLQKELQVSLKQLGKLSSMTLVDRRDHGGKKYCRYRMDFEAATILYHFVFDSENRHVRSGREDIVMKARMNGEGN